MCLSASLDGSDFTAVLFVFDAASDETRHHDDIVQPRDAKPLRQCFSGSRSQEIERVSKAKPRRHDAAR